MASTAERLQILKMIEEGKISAAEGAELLQAINTPSPPPPPPLKGASPPRWLRVRVTDTRNGNQKVNVNIPIGLVNVGMKMGARFSPEMEGMDYQMLMDAVQSGQTGKVMDVTDGDDGERVEIFVE